MDETGRKLGMAGDHLSGLHLLLFVNDTRDTAAVPLLKAFAERAADFRRPGATVVCISASSDAANNAPLHEAAGFRSQVIGFAIR